MDDLDKGKLADEIKVVNLFGKIETLKKRIDWKYQNWG